MEGVTPLSSETGDYAGSSDELAHSRTATYSKAWMSVWKFILVSSLLGAGFFF